MTQLRDDVHNLTDDVSAITAQNKTLVADVQDLSNKMNTIRSELREIKQLLLQNHEDAGHLQVSSTTNIRAMTPNGDFDVNTVASSLGLEE